MITNKAELTAFFDNVFGEQFLTTFGHVSDKSANGPLSFVIHEGDELVAAAACERLYQALKIKDLAVKTTLQGTGLGSRLMADIKQYAGQEGILWIVLTTRSYQAKDFYLKHGFAVYGQLTDMPFAGVTTYYMAYRLPNT